MNAFNQPKTNRFISDLFGQTKSLVFRTTLCALLVSTIFCAKKKEIYYCPMHPTYTSDRPGTCPICGMDLVKKGATELNQKKDPERSSELETGNSSEQSANEFFLSEEKQRSIGIKTDKVLRRNLTKKINLYSNVAYDPDLYAALMEYKAALRSSELFPETGSSITITNLQLRLRQLGLSTEQIRIWTSGQRDPSELILGGKGGKAHIYSQIYESDLSSAKAGLTFRFKTEVYPNIEFEGKIKSIDTILDKNNRTLRLRSEVSDPKQLLKPQMFGNGNIEISFSAILSVPTSAILDTGTRKLAYVRTGPDRFRGVEIRTGKTIENWTEVLSGLEEGDTVVTESTFLIDSEARIRLGDSGEHKH
ncbi:hypothetical protein EHO60_14185 [Leptospira fletcheri]|uniref:Uncharacterized protein n=1 Tax=Leptospira fletcheri TaxID=2484981 RepID=A0A4R9GCI7_9LEPT|nr:efflux RND transporter periplasmic adaptor subunit [Leptospira fletcheri]TGK08727.1 hypothetical protein EHO60_14185 [Leptospira fletcheri]